MPVRTALPTDEPAMVGVLTKAFFHEDLFGITIHPHRNQYPEDVRIFWHEKLRKHWSTPTDRLIVATTTEGGEEKITGVAVWERQGDDEGARKVKNEWIDIGPNAFPPLPTTHNRALDPTKATILEDAFPHFASLWAGPRASNWYLSLCGVHPSYQKRGFGPPLVHWGLERARKEGVHASVAASDGNGKFYLRCGFDEVVGNVTTGEGNPLSGVAGGDVLFMFPGGKEGEGKILRRFNIISAKGYCGS
ncbi:hypothetical protein EJ02DRAFT_227962 [Clathrospora elynae]|uniref:N-acetyltransferase domain-containing protein n=1 Tax=Clathrospora elynae TaxID=706981 RepID=A0A6A5SLK0_9PLEO|nr:hypothetical protein EJ02DRAFT_227962 [Clathrospora elynae]